MWACCQYPGILQLCLSHHVLLVQSLKMSQKWKLEYTQMFMENAVSPTHLCLLLYPQEYIQAFQSSLWITHSLNLPFNFLAKLLFGSVGTSIVALCSWDAKQLPQVVFNKCSRVGLFWQSQLQVRHSNNVCTCGFSRGLQVKSNSDIDLETEVFEKFKIMSVSSNGYKAAVFTALKELRRR